LDFSFVNIKDIFCKHITILKNGGISNLVIFVIFPILIAIASFFINSTSNDMDSILSTSLSVFIGLFINLLLLVVSTTRGFSSNKKRLRIDVIEEMFYNITFVITISLIALIFILIKNITIFPDNWVFYICDLQFNLNKIFKDCISFIFVFLFVEIILTIVLIIKRIFKLFDFDIDEIKNNINKEVSNEDK
jgi:hypothetical protein